jgi:ribose transport system ATP-binding protein
MRHIDKRFPGVHALRGVSLAAKAGEVVALLGENGAGKSTLMKCLGGVHRPDGGEILWDGQPVVVNSVAGATELGIAFIHQELNVLDNLDVAANVFLGREPTYGGLLRLLDTGKMHTETAKYLQHLGLDIAPDTPLARLSMAQRQLVEIAKALSLQARLLIMDEPTSSLTLAETERLLTLVKNLRKQNVGIIFISHRLGEVEGLADRAVVLRDGANAGDLQKAEITHERMVTLMVGRDIKSFYQRPQGDKSPRYFVVEKLRTVRYPQQQITLDVGAGEILGVAGLVGAGRSEMAQAIFGVDTALRLWLAQVTSGRWGGFGHCPARSGQRDDWHFGCSFCRDRAARN